jgi:hypothetical protein
LVARVLADIVSDLARLTRTELDFTTEAASQRLARASLAQAGVAVRVPRIFPSVVTKCVTAIETLHAYRAHLHSTRLMNLSFTPLSYYHSHLYHPHLSFSTPLHRRLIGMEFIDGVKLTEMRSAGGYGEEAPNLRSDLTTPGPTSARSPAWTHPITLSADPKSFSAPTSQLAPPFLVWQAVHELIQSPHQPWPPFLVWQAVQGVVHELIRYYGATMAGPIFNCDPHPGNLLVENGSGKLVVLDWGQVGDLTPFPHPHPIASPSPPTLTPNPDP